MRGRLHAGLLALLLLAAGAVATQAQEQITRRRSLLLFFSFETGGRFTEIERRLLYESLLFKLSAADAPYRVIEWGRKAPDSDRDRTDAALESDCDAWAAVQVLGSSESPGYRIVAYDLVTRKLVTDESYTRDTPLRPRDLERRFWDDGAALVTTSFQTVEMGTRVRLLGVPGTVVAGLPDFPLRVGEHGVLETVLPSPSLYTIRATHRTQKPLTRTFSLREEPLEIDLGQERAPKYLFDASLTTLNFAGGDFGVYAIPNYAYAKVGLTTYLLGVYIGGTEDSAEESKLFQSRPLTQVRVLAGSYFNPPDATVRFYGSLGLVLRFTHTSGLVGLEPISPFAVEAAVGTETSPWKWGNVFFELAPTWYYARNVELLAASYPADYTAFNVGPVGSGLLDFLNYRLGVRWHR